MKKLFTILAFAFLHLTAHAGQEIDKFRQDMEKYLTAQAVNPTELIKYSDEKGDLARAVLDPDRLQKLVLAITIDPYDEKQYEADFQKFGTILNKYREIFETGQGKYDSEYLDVIESTYQLFVTAFKQKIKLKSTNEDEARSINGIIPIAAGAMVLNFEKEINDGKFSKFSTPIARLRLSKLQSLASNLIKSLLLQ
jgi:hypothetical protein